MESMFSVRFGRYGESAEKTRGLNFSTSSCPAIMFQGHDSFLFVLVLGVARGKLGVALGFCHRISSKASIGLEYFPVTWKMTLDSLDRVSRVLFACDSDY